MSEIPVLAKKYPVRNAALKKEGVKKQKKGPFSSKSFI